MNYETSRVLYLLLILVLFAPAWLARGGNHKLRNALIWFGVIVALTLGWAMFHPENFPLPLPATGISHDI